MSCVSYDFGLGMRYHYMPRRCKNIRFTGFFLCSVPLYSSSIMDHSASGVVHTIRDMFTQCGPGGRLGQVTAGWDYMLEAMTRTKSPSGETSQAAVAMQNLIDMARVCKLQHIQDIAANNDLKRGTEEMVNQKEDTESKRRKLSDWASDALKGEAEQIERALSLDAMRRVI